MARRAPDNACTAGKKIFFDDESRFAASCAHLPARVPRAMREVLDKNLTHHRMPPIGPTRQRDGSAPHIVLNGWRRIEDETPGEISTNRSRATHEARF
jgi:hypothetical protein